MKKGIAILGEKREKQIRRWLELDWNNPEDFDLPKNLDEYSKEEASELEGIFLECMMMELSEEEYEEMI